MIVIKLFIFIRLHPLAMLALCLRMRMKLSNQASSLDGKLAIMKAAQKNKVKVKKVVVMVTSSIAILPLSLLHCHCIVNGNEDEEDSSNNKVFTEEDWTDLILMKEKEGMAAYYKLQVQVLLKSKIIGNEIAK